MIEATPADVLARSVRDAAKPLALFLGDALSHCIGSNYVEVCNRVLKRDGANQKTPNPPVDSLLQLDLPSLLKLFDNCFFLAKGVDHHAENDWKVEFRWLFGIPRSSDSDYALARTIGREIAAVRDSRNDLSHLEAGKEVSVLEIKSDLFKLHDLLAQRCLVVANKHESVFELGTRQALEIFDETVQQYIEKLDHSSAEPPGPVQHTAPPSLSLTKTVLRTRMRVLVFASIGLLVIAAFALSLSGVFATAPRNCVGIVLLDTVPSTRHEQIATLIKNHVGAVDDIQVAYLESNGRRVEVAELDTRQTSLLELVKKFNSPGPLADRFEYRTRFDAIYEFIQQAVSREQSPTVLILGSIGDFSLEERRKLQTKEVDLYPQKGMSAWWVSNRVAPPTFVYWQTPTRSDSALFVNFPDKSGEMKPVIEVLR